MAMVYVVQHMTRAGNWIDDQEFTTFERAEAIMEDARRLRMKGTSVWRVERRDAEEANA